MRFILAYLITQQHMFIFFFIKLKICAVHQDLEMLTIGRSMQFQSENSVRILNIYVKVDISKNRPKRMKTAKINLRNIFTKIVSIQRKCQFVSKLRNSLLKMSF